MLTRDWYHVAFSVVRIPDLAGNVIHDAEKLCDSEKEINQIPHSILRVTLKKWYLFFVFQGYLNIPERLQFAQRNFEEKFLLLS